jgi:hypothetical protein
VTLEEWDVHHGRIYNDLRNEGALRTEAEAWADVQTVEQFGPRPQESP